MVSLLVTINTFLYECFEKAKKYPYIWICFVILLAAISLIWLPHWRVSYFGINNATENATLENQYRATIAQILGGGAVAIGIYFAWGNLTTAREGQITERFTRAVDQLGNKKLEIRLGGIYGLERIANESEKDFWPIMEILTACVRIHSRIKKGDLNIQEILHLNEDSFDTIFKVNPDIQAILTVLGRRKSVYINDKSKRLDLCFTNLQAADLAEANLERSNLAYANLMRSNLNGANLIEADLSGTYLVFAFLRKAHLEKANLMMAHLEGAFIEEANLTGADLRWTHLIGTRFIFAHLEEANFEGADLRRAILADVYLENAHLEKANLEKADLKGAKNLTIDQLSKVKTLYEAELDDDLLIPLKEKYPALFEVPEL